MKKPEYIGLFEEIADDSDITITEKTLEKFAERATELELESDFQLDEMYEELLELVTPANRKNDNWIAFVEEISNLVFDEKETDDIVSDDSELE